MTPFKTTTFAEIIATRVCVRLTGLSFLTTHTQTDTQTDTHTDRETDRHTHRHTHTQTDRQRCILHSTSKHIHISFNVTLEGGMIYLPHVLP